MLGFGFETLGSISTADSIRGSVAAPAPSIPRFLPFCRGATALVRTWGTPNLPRPITRFPLILVKNVSSEELFRIACSFHFFIQKFEFPIFTSFSVHNSLQPDFHSKSPCFPASASPTLFIQTIKTQFQNKKFQRFQQKVSYLRESIPPSPGNTN